MPCRIHLLDPDGKPQRAAGLPFWHDHFVCSGAAKLELPFGRYRYENERGPEYERLKNEVTVNDESPKLVRLTLKRIVNLRGEGWYSVDLKFAGHCHKSTC